MDIIEAQISVALDWRVDRWRRRPLGRTRGRLSLGCPLRRCQQASYSSWRLGSARTGAKENSGHGTGDSVRTGMTAMTVESTAMSIAGMGRRAAAVTMSRPLRAAPRAPQPCRADQHTRTAVRGHLFRETML